MIDLKPEWLAIIKGIFKKYLPHTKVVLYGSRARGTKKRYSDIDLCIMSDAPTNDRVLSQLKDAMSESNLPVRVDITDWATTSHNFQQIIAANSEVLIDA
jgi:type I restriction enzyme S subunit